MTEPALSVADMADVTLKLAELALSTAAGNGGAAASSRVRYTLGRLAMAAPATAARLPHVRGALPPEILATVTAQASAAPATAPAPPQPQTAHSRVGSGDAARLLGITSQAVRRAAGRGTLRGTHNRVTGEWEFTRADLVTYGKRRNHGTGRGSRTADTAGAGTGSDPGR